MLGKYITQIGIDPQSHDGQRLIEECILCLSGVNSAFDFQRNVKTIDLTPTGMSGKDVRLRLMEKSYLTVNVKYAALFLSLVPNNADAYVKLQAYLNAEDIAIFRHYFSRRACKANVKAYAIGRGLTARDVTIGAMRHDKKLFDDLLQKATRHIKSRVRKQLSFVMRAENTANTDFTGDLTCKVLRAYHSLIPTKQPEAYIINYLRRAASNETNNLTKKHSTGKRGRMKETGTDGFGGKTYEVICRSENQTHHATSDSGEEGLAEFDLLMGTQVEDHAPTLESSILMSRLLAKFKGRKLRILEILSGHVDEAFTRFLKRKNKLGRGIDHTDYQRRVSHQTFLNTLAEYVGVYQEAFMRFVRYVGGVLTAHKEFA